MLFCPRLRRSRPTSSSSTWAGSRAGPLRAAAGRDPQTETGGVETGSPNRRGVTVSSQSLLGFLKPKPKLNVCSVAAQPTGPCWFCLASPQVEKHLVFSIGTHVSCSFLRLFCLKHSLTESLACCSATWLWLRVR